MLPQGIEPLILQDGTKINPLSGAVLRDNEEVVTEVPNNEAIQHEIVTARRRLHELPVPPNQMNAMSIVLCYTMFGVTEEDISAALSIPTEQIRAIKMHDAYADLQNALVKNIIESDLNHVRGMFVQQSTMAANTMVRLLGSDSEGTQIAAAKDVLDRAGHRPADVVEHRVKMEGGLRIEYVNKKDELPTIDAEVVDF